MMTKAELNALFGTRDDCDRPISKAEPEFCKVAADRDCTDSTYGKSMSANRQESHLAESSGRYPKKAHRSRTSASQWSAHTADGPDWRPPLMDAFLHSSGNPAPEAIPAFDPLGRDLTFRCHVVRVRRRSPAPLLEQILRAFESAGWTTCIPNPFNDAEGDDPSDQLREAVRRLNKSLLLDWLRFHVYGGKIWWEDRIANGKARQRPSRVRPSKRTSN